MNRGVLIGACIGVLFAVWALGARATWLAGLELQLRDPGVPASIARAVRAAEAGYYAERGPLRRAMEHGEDILTFAAPRITYVLDLSVGPYRIKAGTIGEVLPWAIERGYLSVPDGLTPQVRLAQAYFSEQPGLARWQAGVILAQLRDRHPQLRAMGWDQIAADPLHVAKLYSGYMGAGGDWELWDATLRPGTEAMRRMGLSSDGG